MPEPTPLTELALLLGRLVKVEKRNGWKFDGEVEWLSKDGSFHITDLMTGVRLQIWPDEIASFMEDTRAKPPKYNGLFCAVCNEPQFTTESGDVCENGHGGAEGKKDQHEF